jgi:methionine-S-sulfoxide reductase
VGYAGGRKKNPTYTNLGDHTETVQMDYDPSQISYEELLSIFWKSHDPTQGAWSQQYKAVVFYHSEEQKRLAVESRDREMLIKKLKIKTEILAFTGFYLAEDYHQKHRLRQYGDLMKEFRAIYPNGEDFVNSTATARANGYLAGHGMSSEIRLELPDLGLSPTAQKKLLGLVSKSDR